VLSVGELASRLKLIRKYVDLGGLNVSLGGHLPMLLGAAAPKRAKLA